VEMLVQQILEWVPVLHNLRTFRAPCKYPSPGGKIKSDSPSWSDSTTRPFLPQ
jgi:hypothetical protein